MHSLFRIDKNSLTADSKKPTSVAVLPGFDDMVAQHVANGAKPEEPQEAAAERPAEAAIKKEDPAAKKKKELAALDQQIESAKQQARQVIQDAQNEAEAIRNKAQQQGYAEGMQQATASVQQERERETAVVQETVLSISKAKQEMFAQLEESVMDLSMYAAERIVKTELDKNDEIFLNIVKSTLKMLKNQTDITIKVGKDEFERFFKDPSSPFLQELKNSGIAIKQDLALDKGDCVVETEYGTINASISTQLKRLGYALGEI